MRKSPNRATKQGELKGEIKIAQTEETPCTFLLRETSASQYAIVCEPRGVPLSMFRDGSVLLKLRPGLSFGHAEQIRKFLQENVAALIYVERQ